MKIFPEYLDWAWAQFDNDPGPEVWYNMPINEACRRAETLVAVAEAYPTGSRRYRAFDHLKEMVKVMGERYPRR